MRGGEEDEATMWLSMRKENCEGCKKLVLHTSRPSSPYRNCTTEPSESRTYTPHTDACSMSFM